MLVQLHFIATSVLFLFSMLFITKSLDVVAAYSDTAKGLPLGHPIDWQLGFQLPGSPIARGIFSFHDDLMVFLTLILFFVVYVLTICLYTFSSNKTTTTEHVVHASALEIIWTIIPAIILVIIAIPSFSLLYSVDEIVEPMLTVKVIGHQWYWSYELFNTEALVKLLSLEFKAQESAVDYSTSFDSYMLAEEDIAKGLGLSDYRLYVVDKHIGIPANVSTRLLITSNDVLHSWAVPSLGIKVDACPGRLNQASIYIQYTGLFYGQCSEICGTNHAFMPIGVVSFDVSLPRSLLNLLFFDLEPILATLQLIAKE